ncbi:hypothetical protein STRCR_1532 [Streptococcus criceti HS-6]|uniref:Uncharacterized protein n=1 Tax=Streptococcus criceti HS-6 TaxID=873449 RepID=G5JP01_STRCG|nr:hypothetical protein STRCR_1532 [Streptococcus criceti HS-6]
MVDSLQPRLFDLVFSNTEPNPFNNFLSNFFVINTVSYVFSLGCLRD